MAEQDQSQDNSQGFIFAPYVPLQVTLGFLEDNLPKAEPGDLVKLRCRWHVPEDRTRTMTRILPVGTVVRVLSLVQGKVIGNNPAVGRPASAVVETMDHLSFTVPFYLLGRVDVVTGMAALDQEKKP